MNEQPSPTAQASRGSLAIVFLTVFIDLLGFGMVLPLLPLYADQFQMSESGLELGLLMASFSAMQLVCSPWWGRLSDRIGRRPVLMIGLFGSTLFYGLFALATLRQSFALLMVSRIGAGMAGATISTAQAYIADCTTRQGRSKGMALIGMAFGLGFTFGPLLGLLAVPDENSIPGPGPGYVASALSAVALLLAWFKLPESLQRGAGSAGMTVNLSTFRVALSLPSVGLILVSLFVCVFSFANFETTLSLLIKADGKLVASPFRMTWGQVCWTYAFIGFTLALVQGGVVRRLSGRIPEGRLAAAGAALQMAGFGCTIAAINSGGIPLLYGALFLVVTGFACMQPSLNGLLSRRTDPERQGLVLGVGQSVSALARIVGSGLGIPLLTANLRLPYGLAIGCMAGGVALITLAARRGRDFTAAVDPQAEGAEA